MAMDRTNNRDRRTSASIALRSIQRAILRERNDRFRECVRIGLDKQDREQAWREHFHPYND
jgi:hypothetical protein